MNLEEALERIKELEEEVEDLKSKYQEAIDHASDAYDSLRKIL
jgi:hypothetical protein